MINKKKDEQKLQLKKEQILSLDISTHTGYYSPLLGFGTLELTESKVRNNNKQHKAFFDTLIEWIKKYDIKQIVAEDVSAFDHGSVVANKKLCELRGVLLLVCDLLDLPEPCFINPTSAKSWLTGNGHADKQMMMSMLKRRFGFDTNGDDNAADAITFWLMYVKRFKLV